MDDKRKILKFLADTPGWHTAFQIATRLGFVTDRRDERKLVSDLLKQAHAEKVIQRTGKARGTHYARKGEPAYNNGTSQLVTQKQLNAVLAAVNKASAGIKFGGVKKATGFDDLTVRSALKSLIADHAIGSFGVKAQTKYYPSGVTPAPKPQNASESNLIRSRLLPPPSSLPKQLRQNDAHEAPKRRKRTSEIVPEQNSSEVSDTVEVQEQLTVKEAIDTIVAGLTRGKWIVPWDLSSTARDRYGISGMRANEYVMELIRAGEDGPFEREWREEDGRRLMVRIPFQKI